MQSLTEAQIDELKMRDVRIRALDTALLVDQELAESKTLGLIIAAIEDDVNEAMHQFADVNPSDIMTVSALQARVHRLVYFKRTIAFIRSTGAIAADALQSEDATLSEE